jgi:hypothetical protein
MVRIADVLEKLLSNVTQNTDQQYILYMLWKQSNQLEWADDDSYLPLVDLRASTISLVYQDEELDGFSYPITDHEEILLFLQVILQSGKTLYIRFTEETHKIPKDVLLKSIDQALDADDQESFNTHTRQLKEWYG